MYFESLHDLLFMNGHGVYVWSAYAIGFIVVTALVCSPLARHAQLRKQILQQLDLQQSDLQQSDREK